MHAQLGYQTFTYNFDHAIGLQVFDKIDTYRRSGNCQSLPYVFGVPIYNVKSPMFDNISGLWTEEDKMLSYAMMTYWANFVKKG